MPQRPVRHRLGLMLMFAGLILVFVWDSVYGQGFRPGPGMPNGQRPPFGGGIVGGPIGGGMGGGGIEFVHSCSKCGREVGRSKSMLDGPASCPFCGVKFINGGFGAGNPAFGNPALDNLPFGNPAFGNSGMMPGFPNPVPQDPIPPIPPQNPVVATPQAPVTPLVAPNNPTAPAVSRSDWIIPSVVALVLLGILGVGGVWMMIAGSKSDNYSPRRSRSDSRRSLYDEEYD